MTAAQTNSSYDAAVLAGLENGLAAALTQTAEEVKRVECFDDEQRAEVYAILQALRTDTEAHRGIVDLLVRQLKMGRATGSA